MFRLTNQQAQAIVDKMMEDIPYSINIMNDQGVIVGSGKKERVGTVHPGAVQALAARERIEVWEDGPYEKKGTNEPIFIQNECVGVIGITGSPEEVRPFCNLVRTTVVLLIEQKTAMESLTHAAQRKMAFLELLLSHQGPYTQRFKKDASAYSIDLNLKTAVLCIDHLDADENLSKLLLSYSSFPMKEDELLVLVQKPEQLDVLVHQIIELQPGVRIGMGTLESNVADSYLQARQALGILIALKPPAQIIRYADVTFLIRLSGMKAADQANIVAKLEDTHDLLETLRSFIRNNCSISLTATELNIHRNTLQYRLKRIQTVTGKDPRNLLHLFELTQALLSLYK